MRALPLLLAACGLSVEPNDLPDGVFDTPYNAQISNKANLEWQAEGLPEGLALQPDGTLTGTPWEVGSFLIPMTATRGESVATVEVPLEITAPEGMLTCDGEVTVDFEDVVEQWWNLDPDATGTYEALSLVIPRNATSIAVEASASALLYPQEPGEALEVTSAPFPDFLDAGESWRAGRGTFPTLEAYKSHSARLDLLVGARVGGPVTLSMSCETDAVFIETRLAPAMLGSSVVRDLSIWDGTLAQEWTAEGLPSWLELDPERGTVRGIAESLGNHSFTMSVVDGERSASAEVTLGIFEPQDVACGDVLEVQPEEGWLEGSHRFQYDPAGWWNGRLPMDPTVGAITLELTGVPGEGRMGFGHDGAETSTFYAGMDLEDATTTTFSPLSFPPMELLAGREALHITAYADEALESPATLTITCDRAPRLAARALPVLASDDSVRLRAVGGTPPYRWSADDLPDGVSLSEEGVLTSTGAAALRPQVTVQVTDALEASSTFTDTLWVGQDGCGRTPVVRCGEEATADLSELPDDWEICIPDVTGYDRVGVELYSLGDSTVFASWLAPGSAPGEDKLQFASQVQGQGVQSAWVDGRTVPALGDWDHLPMKMRLAGFGRAGLVVVCEDRP